MDSITIDAGNEKSALTAEPVTEVKAENRFKPDMTDLVFALVVFLLGYIYYIWVFFTWKGWGVSIFTVLYLLSVTLYLKKKDALTAGNAKWFWCAITLLTGASYTLWENAGLSFIRNIFLFCSAVYYVIIASGSAVMGNTGNYLILDGVNALMILPFRNFINQYVSFKVLKKRISENDAKASKAVSVLAGITLALLAISCLIPMLKRADSGGFTMILDAVADITASWRYHSIRILIKYLVSAPIAAYIYGLVSGAAHKKGTDIINPETARKTVEDLRIVQPVTIYIALGAMSGLYVLFILCQLPYFFSAFTGQRPEGWLVYSEYARQGFFELCGIAAINLTIITIGNVMSKKHRTESKALIIFNIALVIITLILIATAFSKMALYISAYGLTMPRLLPCVFMIFMIIVFTALIALQKWDFSIVRLALVIGSIMLCLLSLLNPDALVVRYNTSRYLSGTLAEYDMDVLYRSRSAGVLSAIEMYKQTSDPVLKKELGKYISAYSHCAGWGSNTTNLEEQRAYRAW